MIKFTAQITGYSSTKPESCVRVRTLEKTSKSQSLSNFDNYQGISALTESWIIISFDFCSEVKSMCQCNGYCYLKKKTNTSLKF